MIIRATTIAALASLAMLAPSAANARHMGVGGLAPTMEQCQGGYQSDTRSSMHGSKRHFKKACHRMMGHHGHRGDAMVGHHGHGHHRHHDAAMSGHGEARHRHRHGEAMIHDKPGKVENTDKPMKSDMAKPKKMKDPA